MKYQKEETTLNMGSISLSNFVFDEDSLGITMDILEVSDELKNEIQKSIEIEKENHTIHRKEMKEYYPDYPQYTWSEVPVIIDSCFLEVYLRKGKKISYSINTIFHDSKNNHLEACAVTVIDLTQYEELLKKEVLKILIDNFF